MVDDIALEEFCDFKINRGLVDDVRDFTDAPMWGAFIASFYDIACTTVTAVGHYLDESVATMFAACAIKMRRPSARRATMLWLSSFPSRT